MRARLLAMVAAAGMLGGACAVEDPGSSTGTGGGGSGVAGTSGGGGSTGGAAGSTGSGGTTGTGGSNSRGGTTGTGGTNDSGGQSGTAGAAGSAGGAGAGGAIGRGGDSGAAGAGGSAGSGGGGAIGTGGRGGRGGAGGSAGATGGGGAGGSTARGGNGGGGSSAAGGSGSGGSGGPVPSAGCGKPLGTLRSGKQMITSGGSQRSFIIDVPTNYDMNHAYRLFFTFHWIGSTSEAVRDGQTNNGGAANWGYYGLKRMATSANDPAIFIAPQSMGSTWGEQDHPFFDAMLALAKDQLCIDTSRVFATGFSFGGMITYSLSTNHQKDLRAAVGIAPANYNIYLPTNTHEPIPWMSTTGMSDTTCPWDAGNNRGARYAAIGHAMDNGCTIPTTIPTTTVGSRSHVCYDFQGCRPGYPVKVCTFDGGHIAAHADGGTGDNGLTSWIPTESWKFFTQF
jgi:poly(3-hydroxybutyrate) depolymerase